MELSDKIIEMAEDIASIKSAVLGNGTLGLNDRVSITEKDIQEFRNFKTEFNSGFKTTIAVTGFFLTVITSGITFIINYLFKN